MAIKYLKIIGLVLAGFFLGVWVCSYLVPDIGGERDKAARLVMEDASVWFIEKGLSEYYDGKSLKKIAERLEKNGAHLSTSIVIGRNDEMAEIALEYYWVGDWVRCYTRKESKGKIYEYWVIKRSARRDDVKKEIYFLVAAADSLNKKREILHRSGRFFSKYLLPDRSYLNFPVDDDRQIYKLKPWRSFPEAYANTELEGIEVRFENGRYIRRKR
ncbi:MAG: hypothetical protein HYV24_04385 [Deltaproteobacteria bacterium]|nr:hypothetical protein [Deltaproteobacteria bacterium]